MKKTFTRLSLLALFYLPLGTAFGQQLLDAGQHIQPVSKHVAETKFFGSPDLHHQHDGEHCISDALTNHWLESYEMVDEYAAQQAYQNHLAHQTQGDRATYTIPIIFHVIHNPASPAENVSEAAINALLDAVNEDFSATNSDIGNLRTGFGWTDANADIEFCLAQKDPAGQQLAELGIHRVETTEGYFDPNSEANKMKGDTGGDTGTPGWDRNSYVNVWICDITNGASSGVAGYAYKPTVSSLPPASIDGIVIDYNLGMPPTNRVLTHEIGHYLGLSHTWGNSNNASGCTEDDGLTDTPVTAGPSFDYPGSCGGSQQTCSGTETQYENFMDYSNCTVIYTQEQANLMAAVLGGSRASLLASDACTPVNPQPPVTDFVADITTVIEGGSVNISDLSTNYPTGWSWSVNPSTGTSFINGSSATTQDVTIQFTTAGVYEISLTANNAYGNDTEVKTAYINVVASGGGAVACDTLRNYTSAEEANLAIYTLTGEAGYYPSMATINTGAATLSDYADSYFTSTPTEVRRVRFPALQVDDIGAASNVTFTVWADAAGLPGAVLGTESVPLTSLNEGFYNTVDFTTPVPVSGNFWAGWQLDETSFDTLLMATTNFDDRPSGPSSSAVYVDAPFNQWLLTSDLFGSTPDASLIFDVLVSNGPAPIALASWPDAEYCQGMDVTMNGFGSTNADSYYWDISDGSNNYFYDQGNLTTPFTQGNWTISLEVDASCLTDVDGPFNLTINPPMIANFTNTDENCIAADGSITIALSGGDGGPYNYSINNNTTIETSGVYTGLISGSYPYILTDNNNCELTGTTAVGNANSFTPTITPDMTVAALTPTDLNVTGGTSWVWYENNGGGPVQIGTTQTVNVSPAVTTTYVCNVTDGSGCEAELEVTLTVDSGGGIDDELANAFNIYPNPTEGIFSVVFDLNQSKDMQIEVINLVGDKVFSNNFTEVKDQKINFDLTAMSAGIYFVTIQSEGEKVTKKVVLR
ncbi:MAG: M43 family zinc metalloprotease [Crocinitomicaceae bacterium]